MLRYRLRFSTGRAFAIPTGQSKSPDGLANARPFLRTSIAGPTMSIIEIFLVLGRLLARAKESATAVMAYLTAAGLNFGRYAVVTAVI